MLGRWPDRTPIFDGPSIVPIWQRWFSALVDSVNSLHSGIQSGAGSPEGVVTAPIGTLYRRTNGGVGTTLYAKSAGTGNTGWSALS